MDCKDCELKLKEIQRLHKVCAEYRKEIEELKRTSVSWSIEDFSWQALVKENIPPGMVKDLSNIAEVNRHLNTYDAEKFEYALERMIDKHDATIGITWDTIDCYLDEYCRREE